MPRSMKRPLPDAFPKAVTDILPKLEEMRGQTLTANSVIVLELGATPERRTELLRFLTSKGKLHMRSVMRPGKGFFGDDTLVFDHYEWDVR